MIISIDAFKIKNYASKNNHSINKINFKKILKYLKKTAISPMFFASYIRMFYFTIYFIKATFDHFSGRDHSEANINNLSLENVGDSESRGSSITKKRLEYDELSLTNKLKINKYIKPRFYYLKLCSNVDRKHKDNPYRRRDKDTTIKHPLSSGASYILDKKKDLTTHNPFYDSNFKMKNDIQNSLKVDPLVLFYFSIARSVEKNICEFFNLSDVTTKEDSFVSTERHFEHVIKNKVDIKNSSKIICLTQKMKLVQRQLEKIAKQILFSIIIRDNIPSDFFNTYLRSYSGVFKGICCTDLLKLMLIVISDLENDKNCSCENISSLIFLFFSYFSTVQDENKKNLLLMIIPTLIAVKLDRKELNSSSKDHLMAILLKTVISGYSFPEEKINRLRKYIIAEKITPKLSDVYSLDNYLFIFLTTRRFCQSNESLFSHKFLMNIQDLRNLLCDKTYATVQKSLELLESLKNDCLTNLEIKELD